MQMKITHMRYEEEMLSEHYCYTAYPPQIPCAVKTRRVTRKGENALPVKTWPSREACRVQKQVGLKVLAGSMSPSLERKNALSTSCRTQSTWKGQGNRLYQQQG